MGWSVREWNDLSKEVKGAHWTVKEGILKSDERRGTWLVSDAEYGEFTLEFEIKLGELGNSGLALRAPCMATQPSMAWKCSLPITGTTPARRIRS